jgi:putative transposase
MINNWWNKLPNKYPNIELDEFVIMPNHLHGIIIVGADPRVCHETELPFHPDNKMDGHILSQDNPWGEHTGSPLPKPVPLSRIIQWFKTMTTNEYIRNVKQNGNQLNDW